MPEIPVIDLGPGADEERAARLIAAACREVGFFSIVDPRATRHAVPLAALAREFFARPRAEREAVGMDRGGRAWRGWFPPGGELTSGRPDGKEGYYFGRELPAGDPRPLHGPNLFPEHPAGLRDAVGEHMDAMERAGRRVLRLLARGLGIDPAGFDALLGTEPVVLFRIFGYSFVPDAAWGVGEHTDYGMLTLLWQDERGGLEVAMPDGHWVEVEPRTDAVVCNLGDMLDRMTGGRLRSTRHRVRPIAAGEPMRISMPFFLDPAWDARVEPILLPGPAPHDDAATRWDGASVHDFSGTYGEYLLAKVARVFPGLAGHLDA